MFTPSSVRKSIGERLQPLFTEKWFLSLPVLRIEEEKTYLAVFGTKVYSFDRATQNMERPSLWILANPVSFETEVIYACDIREFSDAEYGTEYSTKYLSRHDHLEEMILQRDFLFDKWYSVLINEGRIDREIYDQYLEVLVRTVPDSYRRFFLELSFI